jgi:hypothetical protein
VAFHWKSEQAGGEHPENLIVGVRYHDTMVRAGDKWIISRRRVDPDWRSGPYPSTYCGCAATQGRLRRG